MRQSKLPPLCLHFVNNCRLGDTVGVERWLLDGAPLMRIFKATELAQSPDDEAAAMRLKAVVHRSKNRNLPDPHSEEPELPEPPGAPEIPQ